jgi:hypothetical protein
MNLKAEKSENSESETATDKPGKKLEPKTLKKAVLYLAGTILVGSAIVAFQAENNLKPTTLTDQMLTSQMRQLIGRNYTNPVILHKEGATRLYLYDCGQVDTDKVVINGLTFTLPPPSTPLEVVLPGPVSGLQIQSVDDGTVGPTTLGITSELKSVSCVGLNPGESALLPTTLQ